MHCVFLFICIVLHCFVLFSLCSALDKINKIDIDFVDFRQEMVKLFDRSARVEEAAAQLALLHQGGSSVTEFTTKSLL